MKRSIAFWNLERLFSGSVSALRADLADHDEWTKTDATNKVRNARAILAALGERHGPPAIVGVCEVETPDLVRRLGQWLPTPLTSVDAVSDDASAFALAGINLGLLVDRSIFDGQIIVQSHIIDRTFDTRDILECTLESSVLDRPVTVYVNHWASRLASEGEQKRVAAGHYLRSLVRNRVRYTTAEMLDHDTGRVRVPKNADLLERARQPVIVMGDFNDEPFDASIEILAATPDEEKVRDDLRVRGRARAARFASYRASTNRLYDPFWAYATGQGGSYYRSPRWRIYDQIMVSRGLLDPGGRGLSLIQGGAHVFADPSVALEGAPPLQMLNRAGKPKSFDPQRLLGCSDHLPVVVEVEAPD